MIEVRETNPREMNAARLIKELDDFQLGIYPAESNHLDNIDELIRDNVYFVGAYDADVLVGIGAIKFVTHDVDYAEVKRVYVSFGSRGRGISKLIMQALEERVKLKNVTTIRLETGIYQPQAIGLYEKLGYHKRPLFGDYPNDPLSVFMEKTLS